MGNIVVNLPDGSGKDLPKDSNGNDLAALIGPGLAKDAVAMSVNGEQRDLSDTLADGDNVSIITIKSDEGLEIMRHTLTAQVLAQAVKNIYPTSKLAIGPTIEDGFYYDFLFEKPISSEELPKIEEEMRKIISNKSEINKTLHDKKDAISKFKNLDEGFKASIIEEAEQKKDFQIYEQKETGFIDLCRGPHLPSLKYIGEFKLTNSFHWAVLSFVDDNSQSFLASAISKGKLLEGLN